MPHSPFAWSACTLGLLAAVTGCGNGTKDAAEGAAGANVSGSPAAGGLGAAGLGRGGAASGGRSPGAGGAGAGGTSATGGTPSGGAGGTGGSGSGGTPGSGGTGESSSGGAPGGTSSVSGNGGTSGGALVDCTIEASATLATKIPSVIVTTFTTDLEAPLRAVIEFGKDTSYGLEAPVDLTAADYRTLLLGVPFETEAHYRITVESAAGTCQSDDQSITTGAPPAGAPEVTPVVTLQNEVTPGFVVLGVTGGWASIYDHTGALVWAYKMPISGVMPRVDFTYDGASIIARDGNPSGQTGGQIRRVTLDGETEAAITLDRSHHDFTATPDNGIVFFTGHTDSCGKLVKMAADGTFSDLFVVADAFDSLAPTGSDRCHMNSLHYHELDDSISFSVLNEDAYVKITSSGALEWVLGGDESDFSGDGSSWTRQHGHMMPDENHLLFFNNRSNGATALAVEVELDRTAKTATKIFEYEGGGSSQTLGDVQRLPSGNTLVTYCNDGLQHEVNAARELVRSFEWTGGVGYATHRPTLYGKPPAR